MSKRYLTAESKFNCDDDAVQCDAILQTIPSVSSRRGCSQKKEIKSEAINPSSFLLQRELGPVCSLLNRFINSILCFISFSGFKKLRER